MMHAFAVSGLVSFVKQQIFFETCKLHKQFKEIIMNIEYNTIPYEKHIILASISEA